MTDKETFFLNPFSRIVHEVHNDTQQQEDTTAKTPQRCMRPFRPPTRVTSSLSPYLNLLHNNKPGSEASRLLTTPKKQQRLASSPYPEEIEENYQQRGSRTTENQEEGEDAVIDELKDVYKSLSEQTRQVESLRCQIISLKTARNNMVKDHAKTLDEMQKMKIKLDEAMRKIQTLEIRLQRNEVALDTKAEQLSGTNDVLKSKDKEIGDLRGKLERTTNQLEELKVAYKDEVGKKENMESNNSKICKRLAKTISDFRSCQDDLIDLRRSHQVHWEKVDLASQAIKDWKANADELQTQITMILDSGGIRELLSVAKSTMVELREELAGTQRVNDLLRDKLHNTSTQLADATNRVQELEREKCNVWNRTMEIISGNTRLQESLVTSESKVENVAKALALRESETFDALARVAELEAKLKHVTTHKEEQEVELTKLRIVREDNVQLRSENAGLEKRLSEETSIRTKLQSQVEVSRDTLMSTEKDLFVLKTQYQDTVELQKELIAELSTLKLTVKELETSLSNARDEAHLQEKNLRDLHEKSFSTVQETLQKRNQEIVALNTCHEADETVKEQLRVTFSQEQGLNGRLQHELKEAGIREAMAIGKLDICEGRISHLTREVEQRDQIIRQGDSKIASLQERYDAQSGTLRLVKEELGDMQERLLNITANNDTSLASLRTEIALVQEQKITLTATVSELRRQISENEARSNVIMKDLKERLGSKTDEHSKLIQEYGRQKESSVERITELQGERERLQATISRLESEIQTEVTLRKEQEDGERSLEQDTIASLTQRIDTLVREKEQYRVRENTLLARYDVGELSDIEKDFVQKLMHKFRNLHEEEAITKENEIKRRDAVITSLQIRIEELESSIVSAFQPAELGPDQSILDLNISPFVTVTGEDINTSNELDSLLPLSSQMPSELSTPPQSPKRLDSTISHKTIHSFVELANEVSDDDYGSTKKEMSSKRSSEDRVEAPKKRVRLITSRKENQEQQVNDKPMRGRPKRRKAQPRANERV